MCALGLHFRTHAHKHVFRPIMCVHSVTGGADADGRMHGKLMLMEGYARAGCTGS